MTSASCVMKVRLSSTLYECLFACLCWRLVQQMFQGQYCKILHWQKDKGIYQLRKAAKLTDHKLLKNFQ